MMEEELRKLLQDIQNQLIELNSKLDEKAKKDIHLHIQNVTIDTLHLDELSYHLDKIDIKELSGMLNLGNSFSPKIQSKKQQHSKKMDSKPKDSSVGSAKNDANSVKEKKEELEPLDAAVKINVNGREVNYRFAP